MVHRGGNFVDDHLRYLNTCRSHTSGTIRLTFPAECATERFRHTGHVSFVHIEMALTCDPRVSQSL